MNDGQTLTREDAETLCDICNRFSMELAGLAQCEVSQLCVVAFASRSLEHRWISHPICLEGPALTDDKQWQLEERVQEHRGIVDNLLGSLTPDEILRGLKRPEPRFSRYKEPHSEFTLVLDIGQAFAPVIEGFTDAVDPALPGRYSWFGSTSRHVTIRGQFCPYPHCRKFA